MGRSKKPTGGTALFDPPVSKAPAPAEAFVPVADKDLGAKIRQNLCGVYVTIRRPSGRPMVKEAKIEATTKDADQSQVTSEDITKPCWKIDVHPLWKKIDLNGAAIESCLNRYSVSASIKGEHLVSLLRAGLMLNELNTLRNERMLLADEMREKWYEEVLPGLEQRFPQFYENQIKDRLPDPAQLRERFDVYWLIRPLTPLDNSHINLDGLSEADAREVMNRNNEFIDKIVQQQLGTIFEEAFSQVVTLCEEINSGEYAFGKRKAGAVSEILDALAKVKNFGDFANEGVLRHVDVAVATIQKYNISQINGSTTVQAAIKNAMKPLGAALKELTSQAGNTRARRAVSI